jgi:hypothetical protein
MRNWRTALAVAGLLIAAELSVLYWLAYQSQPNPNNCAIKRKVVVSQHHPPALRPQTSVPVCNTRPWFIPGSDHHGSTARPATLVTDMFASSIWR